MLLANERMEACDRLPLPPLTHKRRRAKPSQRGKVTEKRARWRRPAARAAAGGEQSKPNIRVPKNRKSETAQRRAGRGFQPQPSTPPRNCVPAACHAPGLASMAARGLNEDSG